jgi:hypothetical protein
VTSLEENNFAKRKLFRTMLKRAACWLVGIASLSYVCLSTYSTTWLQIPSRFAEIRTVVGKFQLFDGGRSQYSNTSYVDKTKVRCSFSPLGGSYACSELKKHAGVEISAKVVVLRTWSSDESLVLEAKNLSSERSFTRSRD